MYIQTLITLRTKPRSLPGATVWPWAQI